MAKWIVRGTVEIEFEMTVDANSEDEAYEMAEETWDGPNSSNVNVLGEDEPDFYDASPDGPVEVNADE